MKYKSLARTAACFLAAIFASGAQAMLISGQDIIAAPAAILDAAVVNDQQQAFDEKQGVALSGALLRCSPGCSIPALMPQCAVTVNVEFSYLRNSKDSCSLTS